jgi:hypothetical protein
MWSALAPQISESPWDHGFDPGRVNHRLEGVEFGGV